MTTTYNLERASVYESRNEAHRAARALNKKLLADNIHRNYAYAMKYDMRGGWVVGVSVIMGDDPLFKGWLDDEKETQ